MYILLRFQLLTFSKITMLGKSYQLAHKAQPGIPQHRLSASRDTGILKSRFPWQVGRVISLWPFERMESESQLEDIGLRTSQYPANIELRTSAEQTFSPTCAYMSGSHLPGHGRFRKTGVSCLRNRTAQAGQARG